MSHRILLVEDDSTLAMIVSETLQRDGFEVTVASDGEEGLLRFTRDGADLVVADVMMPRMDGFEMARRIRRTDPRAPILFLTAKSEIDDVVTGFELGGNDYLSKPFRMLELIVRIKALLRRNAPEPTEPQDRYEIGAYTLDMTAQTLTHKDNPPVTLTIIEAKILEALVRNIGHTVEAAYLMQLIWQREDPYTRNSLHGFIHKLRHHLSADPTLRILNQRSRGYKLTQM